MPRAGNTGGSTAGQGNNDANRDDRAAVERTRSRVAPAIRGVREWQVVRRLAAP
jgi:hypothetical protein